VNHTECANVAPQPTTARPACATQPRRARTKPATNCSLLPRTAEHSVRAGRPCGRGFWHAHTPHWHAHTPHWHGPLSTQVRPRLSLGHCQPPSGAASSAPTQKRPLWSLYPPYPSGNKTAQSTRTNRVDLSTNPRRQTIVTAVPARPVTPRTPALPPKISALVVMRPSTRTITSPT